MRANVNNGQAALALMTELRNGAYAGTYKQVNEEQTRYRCESMRSSQNYTWEQVKPMIKDDYFLNQRQCYIKMALHLDKELYNYN